MSTEPVRPLSEIEPFETGMLGCRGRSHHLLGARGIERRQVWPCFCTAKPGGTISKHRRPFDPALYDVILFRPARLENRCPTPSLEANTTWHLVADRAAARNVRLDMAGVRRIVGSPWRFAYAETHPERVRSWWCAASTC